MSLLANLQKIRSHLPPGVQLVAVSKNQPPDAINKACAAGQYVFGENRVQEMVAKKNTLARNVEWHMIGHLQTNKVKYIASFVSLIHSVDSLKLLEEIAREGAKNRRVIDCLLQIHISLDETKYGLTPKAARNLLESISYRRMEYVRIRGLMGMATFTDNEAQIRSEFKSLRELFEDLKALYFSDRDYFTELSMGMSNDYLIAVQEGSTMVRIGRAVFHGTDRSPLLTG